MRVLTTLVILLACNNGFCDTIKKWTDDSVQVHYVYIPPLMIPHHIKQREIEDSFYPEAFDQAIKRNAELSREIR